MSCEESKEHQLALEAYKLLFDMLQHEETLFWNRNQTFLVINAAMFTILGLIRPKEIVVVSPAIQTISFVICFFSAIICFLWLIVVRRSEAFYDHWYEQLKFLEKQYLQSITIFRTADEYFSRGKIEIGGKSFKLGPLAKRLRIYMASTAVPAILILVWIGLGIYLSMFS